MERVSLTIDRFPREYLLFAPPQSCALVLFLPGKGATAAWADGETGWSQLARREGFALAVPEGLPPDPARPPKFLTNPPRWNDGSNPGKDEKKSEIEPVPSSSFAPRAGSFPEIRPPSVDDVGFLAAVLDDVARRTGAIPERTFLTGFSNGAGMAFRFAAERAERIAAVAPVAGHCWVREPTPVRPLPTLYVVGSVDPLIPLRGGDVRSPWQHRLVPRPPVAATLERWATAIGCNPIPTTESDLNGVRVDTYPGPVPFRSLLVEGLGHHWPGGNGQLNPRLAGPPSSAVNGTEVAWEFFRQFV